MTRGQGTHQKKGETKQQIIKFIASNPSLVVEEPELRQYLKTEHDIREPKNIKQLLKDLSEENLITKTVKRGFENKWSIENVIQLQIIVEKFNDITKILQKNDKIRSMLIDMHFSQPFYYKESYELFKVKNECRECLKSLQRPNSINCNLNEDERKNCKELEKKALLDRGGHYNVRQISALQEMSKNIENTVNIFDSRFKEYLKISPCFFKMCLRTPEEFEETFNKIFKLQMKGLDNLEKSENFYEGLISRDERVYNYYDNVFEICVHTDIINNEVSDEAIEYVHNMKRRT